MRVRTTTIAVLLVALAAVFGVKIGAAAQVSKPATAAHRLIVSTQQRTLTERMAGLFCFAYSDVDFQTNADHLAATREAFVKAHAGLRQGDDDLFLYAETDAKLLQIWQDVDRTWSELDSIYAPWLTGELTLSEIDFDRAMRLTDDLVNRHYEFAAETHIKYSKDLQQLGVQLQNQYARQDLLSQKMSKELCLMARGYDLPHVQKSLAKTVQLFDGSLEALVADHLGAEHSSINVADIAAKLQDAHARWRPVQTSVIAVTDGQWIGSDNLSSVATELEQLRVDIVEASQFLAQSVAPQRP